MVVTINDRLQSYFTSKRLTMAQVSRATGIQYDTLQQILSGKVKAMGVDKFTSIWQAYPDMDAWYILTGEPLRDQRQAAAVTTVEQLKEFKAEMIESLNKRIQELGG